MKLKIEKVLKQLALKEYAEAYDKADITVWTNPPREMRKRLSVLRQEFMQAHLDQSKRELDIKAFRKNNPAPVDLPGVTPVVLKEEGEYQASLEAYKAWILEWNLRAQAWYAEIWSQGAEDTHWTVEELQAIDQEDPNLLAWMIDRTQELLDSKKG